MGQEDLKQAWEQKKLPSRKPVLRHVGHCSDAAAVHPGVEHFCEEGASADIADQSKMC